MNARYLVVVMFAVCVTALAASAQTKMLRPTLSEQPGGELWDYMLHLEGIQGEATAGYAGWIIASGFHQMMERPIGAGGRATGRPAVNPVIVYKRIDRASPGLYERCLNGGQISTGVLVMNPRATPANHLRLEMSDILIVSVETTATASGRPLEILKLAPASIVWRYRTGESGGDFTSRWNRNEAE